MLRIPTLLLALTVQALRWLSRPISFLAGGSAEEVRSPSVQNCSSTEARSPGSALMFLAAVSNCKSGPPLADVRTTPPAPLLAVWLCLQDCRRCYPAFSPIHNRTPVGVRVWFPVTRSQGVERGTSTKQFALRTCNAVAVATP